jgi:hypothetical protein
MMHLTSRTTSITALWGVLLITILACTTGGLLGGDGTLYEDDFSDPGSGWDQIFDEYGTNDYKDGSYQILVSKDNYFLWSLAGKSFDDVRIEVDITRIEGPEDSEMGIICRHTDDENFYFAVISPDGFFATYEFTGEGEEFMGEEEYGTSSAIKGGSETNHLRLDCIGNTISLYVNDELLTEVIDSSFSKGDVGFIAGTFDDPGADIRFDNFKVFEGNP